MRVSALQNLHLPAPVAQPIGPVGLVLRSAGSEARHQNFLAASLYTLRFQLAAYALCFLLIFLLPAAPKTAA